MCQWCAEEGGRVASLVPSEEAQDLETRYYMYVSMKAEARGYTDEFRVEKKNKWQMPNFFRKREGVSRRLV